MFANEGHELGRIARLAYDVEAGALEQPCQAFPEEDVVVGEHDPRPARRHAQDYGAPSHVWVLPGSKHRPVTLRA